MNVHKRCRGYRRGFLPVESGSLAGPRCRLRLLGVRLSRELRGLAGLRLRRTGIVELPFNVLTSFPELVHALPQASRQVRQLFRPEEDENDEKDDYEIRTT